MDKLLNSEYGENSFKRSGASETDIHIHTVLQNPVLHIETSRKRTTPSNIRDRLFQDDSAFVEGTACMRTHNLVSMEITRDVNICLSQEYF